MRMHPAVAIAFIATLLAWTACVPALAEPSPKSSAAVTDVVNEVSLLKPRQPAVPASKGDEVAAPANVQTGVQSRSELTFRDSTLLRLGSSTRFSFLEGKKGLNLKSGTMLLRSSKTSGETQIHAGGVTAAIRG